MTKRFQLFSLELPDANKAERTGNEVPPCRMRIRLMFMGADVVFGGTDGSQLHWLCGC
jgi:hypothetical protein